MNAPPAQPDGILSTQGPAIRWPRLIPLLIVGAVVLAYARSFGGAFVYDDMVTLRIALRQEGRRLFGLLPLTSRPLADLTFVLNGLLSGTRAADYRLVNVAFHAFNACLVWALLRRRLRPGWGEEAAVAVSAGAAFLWGCHPLTTAAVTYVSQRYEVMASTGYLLTLYAASRAEEGQGAARWSLLSVLACAAAMASKEVAITAPLAVLLTDWMFARPGSLTDLLRRRKWTYLGLAAGWILLGVLMNLKTAGRHAVGARVPPWLYAAVEMKALGRYLKLVFWPTDLCFEYGWPIRTEGWVTVTFGVWIGLLLLLTAVGVLRRERAALPWAWFFLLLAPTSSLIPRPDPIMEHRAYLASAGLVAGAVGLLWRVVNAGRVRATGRATRRPRVFGCVMAGLVALAAWRTALRNADYADDLTLWRRTVLGCPRNLRARLLLASALLVRGEYGEARGELEAAWRMAEQQDERGYVYRRTALAMLHNNLGAIHAREKRFDQAAEHFRRALSFHPGAPDIQANLQRVLDQVERASVPSAPGEPGADKPDHDALPPPR